MLAKQKAAAAPQVKIPELNVATSTNFQGKPCTKYLKDVYDTPNDLVADLTKNAEKMLEESAPVYLDGRQIFPLTEEGIILDTGAVFDEENGVWLKAKVGASTYTTDPDGKIRRPAPAK